MKTEANTRRRILWGALLLALVCAFPLPSKSEVQVGIGIGLPPIVFGAPPELVVLPGSNIYVAPDVEADIFFYNGWWWRPWEGRWYRSLSYDSGWYHYRHAPPFYRHVPRHWRRDYREHRWQGRQWNYERMHHRQVEKNWRGWEKSRHWERQHTRRPHDSFRRPDTRHPSREMQRHTTGSRHTSRTVQQHNSHKGTHSGGQDRHKRRDQ
jgi:hypothetical protein